MSINATSPFKITIDKLSITKSDFGADHARIACNRLIEMAEHNPLKLRLKAGHRHHLQGELKITGSNSPLLIQAGARHSGISDYRIELNPSKLATVGLEEVREFLDNITFIGFQEFFNAGKVTRIDVALDLPGLTLEDVTIRSKGQRKHGLFSGAGGKLETIYLGSPRANGSVAYVREDDDGDNELRIERRLKPNCLGSDLRFLPNPFHKIELVSTASIVCHLTGMIPQQFFDSVRLRGVRAVLKTLPRKQRQAILTTLSDPSKSLLPPMNLIWQRWHSLLWESLQIGGSYDEQQTLMLDEVSDEADWMVHPINMGHPSLIPAPTFK